MEKETLDFEFMILLLFWEVVVWLALEDTAKHCLHSCPGICGCLGAIVVPLITKEAMARRIVVDLMTNLVLSQGCSNFCRFLLGN